MLRNPAANDKVTQALLGEDAGHDDEAEHHRQQQVEQVVSRVERSDPDREGQQQEPHALRRGAAMMARRYSIRLSSSRTFSTRSCRSKTSWVVSTGSSSSAGCSNCGRSSTFFSSALSG